MLLKVIGIRLPIRGAGSVIKLVEPTSASDVIYDSSSGVQGQGRSHLGAEALINLHLFVAKLNTVYLRGFDVKVHFLKMLSVTLTN